MEITKLEHSGIVLKKGEKRVVFDPVEFKEKIPKLENVVAIVITHKHGDHLQDEVLSKIVSDNPDVKIFAINDTALLINDAIIVRDGDVHKVGGFKLEFFGKSHAAIVSGQIPCENIGAIVDGVAVNPGDSFDCPVIGAKVLFVPISAPWLKISESMGFVEKVKPQIVIPVHDALLSDLGKSISDNWMKKACDEAGAEYKELKFNEEFVC